MNQPYWDTLAIVGVGLIGGSIGLAARERGLAKRIVGIGRRESSLKAARMAETVTETTTDLAQGVSNADFIVVCTPVDQIGEHICQVARNCPAMALITDAGSTKAEMVRYVESRVDASTRFVGSHPLAGSHESGPGAAKADLYVDRTVVVTPTAQSAAADADEVSRFWRLMGAKVVRMDVDVHDAALAASSHVPHVVAAALASATPKAARQLVAGGWLDTTRIAGADPSLWVSILQQNRDHVLAALDRFTQEVADLRHALRQNDVAEIERLLSKGKRNRDETGDGND